MFRLQGLWGFGILGFRVFLGFRAWGLQEACVCSASGLQRAPSACFVQGCKVGALSRFSLSSACPSPGPSSII